VTAVGVAMAKNSSGWPYWTLVLGAEKANAKIEGVPCHPTLRLTQSLQAKSCRSSDSLLTGQVAGPVLLLPRRPKRLRYPLQDHDCLRRKKQVSTIVQRLGPTYFFASSGIQ